ATTTTTPDQGFLAEIEQQLDYEDPSTPSTALSMAHSMCDGLDLATAGPQADDAANDTPHTDASVSTALTDMGLDQVMDANLDDNVTAVIMTTGVDYLCPQHLTLVAQYL